MSLAYEEILQGESLLRSAPDARHELICDRLHQTVAVSVEGLSSTKLLPSRSVVRISAGSMMRPDLALVAAATGKLWLAAEVVNAYDHRMDTVVKKTVYEEMKLARLWMVDPRYNNVEVYHGSPYGLVLKAILAGSEALQEELLPGFSIGMRELFAG
jgi:hypothetical protein